MGGDLWKVATRDSRKNAEEGKRRKRRRRGRGRGRNRKKKKRRKRKEKEEEEELKKRNEKSYILKPIALHFEVPRFCFLFNLCSEGMKE